MTEGGSDRESIDRHAWGSYTRRQAPLNVTLKAMCAALFDFANSDGSNIFPTHERLGRVAGGLSGRTVGECIRALILIGLLRKDRQAAERTRTDWRTAQYQLIQAPDCSERIERVQRETGTEFITAKGIESVLARTEDHQRRGATEKTRKRDESPAPGRCRQRKKNGLESVSPAPGRVDHQRRGAQIPAPGRYLNTEEHTKEHSANTRSVTEHVHAREREASPMAALPSEGEEEYELEEFPNDEPPMLWGVNPRDQRTD